MKTFYGIVSKKTDKVWEIIVYRISRNTPKYIGEFQFNYGMSKGFESEIFQFLVDKKLIPRKLLGCSLKEGRGEGYYCQEVMEKGYRIFAFNVSGTHLVK